VRKEKWVYMNFNTRTNPGGRLPILNRFKDAPYITVAGNMGFRDYLQELARHVFCISPPGNGLDCHRIWECLYLGVIPVVLKNPNIRYYDDLPVLLIDDWKEINPEFLEEKFRIFKTRAFNLEKLDLAYWKKVVYSQKGKLRVPDRSEVKRLVYKPQDYDGQLREPELQEMAGAARDEKAYQIVQKLIKDGREKEAIGALKMFLVSYPGYALAYNDLGVLYRNNGNKEKALKHCKQATDLDPENTTFQKNLADSYYLDAGYIEEALRIYLALLEKDPVDTETLLILGQICVSLEKFDDAAVFYNKVIELEPLNEHARGKLDSILNNNFHGI
jgi:tetratricopeptide (TPR) repeat protein